MAKEKKTTRASKTKKVVDSDTKQVHGAVEPQPMNMMKMFGINDGYEGVEDVNQYRKKLEGMTITDLHDHSHKVGIVPLDAREKLILSLERRFLEAKARQLPNRTIKIKTRADSDPEFAKFMKQWQSGEFYNKP